MVTFELRSIGTVRSPLRDRAEAPKQGHEGAPEAWLELDASVAEAFDGTPVLDLKPVLDPRRAC
jgi:tRNA (Thr-GGU) A37 N-methylase